MSSLGAALNITDGRKTIELSSSSRNISIQPVTKIVGQCGPKHFGTSPLSRIYTLKGKQLKLNGLYLYCTRYQGILHLPCLLEFRHIQCNHHALSNDLLPIVQELLEYIFNTFFVAQAT